MARKATTRTNGKADSAKQSPSQRERDLAVAGVRIPDAATVEAQFLAAQAEEAANLAAEAAEMAIEAAKPTKQQYTGPMLILRQRLKAGAYGKMANGQPACGDQLAQMLGSLNSAQVIRACMIAMAIEMNPYAHLNIGQQSMNLRNKLRGMLKAGVFGYGVVTEAVEEVMVVEAPASTDDEQAE